MADVELIIKIDEDTYKDIKAGKIYTSFRDVPQESVVAIANGTPLPKGHGRLIDADDFFDEFCEIAIEPYINTPTIIEADKAESEE